MKIIRITAFVLSAARLCGCAAVSDRPPIELSETAETAQETEEAAFYDEVRTTKYDVSPLDDHIKLNAEGGVFEGNIRTDGEYDGNGYIVLDKGGKLRHIAAAASSQFYSVAIAAQSFTGAAIRLSVANESIGTYYIPASEEMTFSLYAVDNIYLPEGPAILSFDVIEGTASLDYMLIDSSAGVNASAYRIGSSVVGSNTAVETIGVMKYLNSCYGEHMLTAQNVTPGANAEIDAVYAETGRYPAIRSGDLLYATLVSDTVAEKNAAEQAAAVDWGKRGGIVAYAWHWYTPTGEPEIYSDKTDFNLGFAVTDRDIALSDIEEIEALSDSDMVSGKCLALVRDIDTLAQTLKELRDQNITVIFEPVPDGDSSIYWWGGNAESYVWLWRLIFTRLNSYHGLNNLIWVWNGSNADFYPGDSYCDIIGQSFFEQSSASFAGRFGALSRVSDTDTKPIAVTACDTLPNPDYCVRDNAMWLWCAGGSGNCTITSTGELTEAYNSWQKLHDFYNNAVTITLDELPDFAEFAFSE